MGLPLRQGHVQAVLRRRIEPVRVGGVQVDPVGALREVRGADAALARPFRGSEHGKEKATEDHENAHDDEQLDK